MIAKDDVNPVLLVVDDNHDPELAESLARHRSATPVKIQRCASAKSALEYLDANIGHTAPKTVRNPSCILLDLPGKTRWQVLGKIKEDATLCVIPVIVVSASRDQRDIDACYRAGANACITKPQNGADLDTLTCYLQSFMFDISTLPTIN